METIRELNARWESLPFEEKKAILKARDKIYGPYLRDKLVAGDKIRASAAQCFAREATFTFSHWEGGWIVSASGKSIAPQSVYSVNGEVLRLSDGVVA